jgi:Rad3-related DNA helicase
LFVDSLSGFVTLLDRSNSHCFRAAIVLDRPSGGRAADDEFKFFCLDASVVFRRVEQQVRSAVLASGTLRPFDVIAEELRTIFPLQVATKHVIPDDQVCVLAIGRVGGVTLTTQRRALDVPGAERRMDEAFATLLFEAQRGIKGGVLVFAPSYAKMQKLDGELMRVTRGRLDRPVFRETRDTDKTADIPRDGLVLGVCRGKLSEGIDFSDDRGRAVFVYGIPYASSGAAEIALKMEFNDLHAKISGRDWHRAQGFIALNQAIGRVIRHSKDYGAIILVDERLTLPSSRAALPGWIASQLRVIDGGQLPAALDDFLRRMRARFGVQDDDARPQGVVPTLWRPSAAPEAPAAQPRDMADLLARLARLRSRLQ